MANKVYQLLNGNVYFDGNSHAGQVEETNLPEVKFIYGDRKSLSNIARFKIFQGIEPIDWKVKLNSVNRANLVLSANPLKPVDIMVRTTIQTWENGEMTGSEPGVAFLRGTPMGIPSTGLKPNDNAEIEISYTITSYRLEIGGSIVYDIDVYANKFIVDGVDLLGDYRSNLGLD